MACYDDKATEHGPIYQMVMGPFFPEVVVSDPKTMDVSLESFLIMGALD